MTDLSYMSNYDFRRDAKGADIADMIGKTFTVVEQGGAMLRFQMADGADYIFTHDQDCCESVSIEDVCGDLTDLVDSPIVIAEERSERDDKADESGTFTFYEFRTAKGSVTVRWYGTSNGYYSESVDLYHRPAKGETK